MYIFNPIFISSLSIRNDLKRHIIVIFLCLRPFILTYHIVVLLHLKVFHSVVFDQIFHFLLIFFIICMYSWIWLIDVHFLLSNIIIRGLPEKVELISVSIFFPFLHLPIAITHLPSLYFFIMHIFHELLLSLHIFDVLESLFSLSLQLDDSSLHLCLLIYRSLMHDYCFHHSIRSYSTNCAHTRLQIFMGCALIYESISWSATW